MNADQAHELGFNDGYAATGYRWRQHGIPEELSEDYSWGYIAGYNAANN
jgi:hypothetical protein